MPEKNFVVQVKYDGSWHNVNSKIATEIMPAGWGKNAHLVPMEFSTAVFVYLVCRFLEKTPKERIALLRIADKENNRLTPRLWAWYEKIYDSQGQPQRYVYKGWGIYIWKWAGAFFPEVTFSFGDLMKYSITLNNVFHNGRGIRIHFGDFIILNWAYERQIGWWFEKNFQLGLFFNRKNPERNQVNWKYQWGFEHRKETA